MGGGTEGHAWVPCVLTLVMETPACLQLLLSSLSAALAVASLPHQCSHSLGSPPPPWFCQP